MSKTFDLAEFLSRNRDCIVDEWIRRLKYDVDRRYEERPISELRETVTQAFDCNRGVLIDDDYTDLNCFIEKITQIRLAAGFSLSHVQMAFELFREIVIPLLDVEKNSENLAELILPINDCLAYTIHRFSDHFQAMHEKTIRKHNLQLKEEVRKRTAELAESERKYKTLVEEISDGYVVVRDEVIIFANWAFARLHDCRPEEVIGAKFYCFVAPESQEKILDIYRKSMRRSKRFPGAIEYLRLTKNGDVYPTEILARVTWYEGRLSTLGICRDITERVRLERTMREAERMATIGQITTSLSHEIRNPLSAIKLNLQVIKKNEKLEGNDRRRIDISVQEVKRLEGILQELLDFAKPLTLNLKSSHINSIVAQCLELLEIKFKEKEINVSLNLDQALPRIVFDPGKFRQAVMNLVINAIEASPVNGAIKLETRFIKDEHRAEALVCVRDEGPGLFQKNISELVKPFFTTKSQGTGLGLTNAERVITAHGGRLEVADNTPSGAVFTLVVPLGGLDV